jgi:hypothetical protein
VPDIRYVNVDLMLESSISLASIVEAFGAEVLLLHQSDSREIYLASFETAHWVGDAESAIDRLCLLAENLPEGVRKTWDSCFTRIFDIGYKSGDSPQSFRSILHPDTIKRVAALGAGIVVTIYPLVRDGA